MSANIDNTLDLEAFINQTNDLVSQQEVYLTNSVIINVEELVSGVSDLISLPEIYLQIRTLMDDMNSSLDDFASVVNTDPGLVALVLKIVNSAFYGFAGQIDNINRALNLIGIGQLHDLVLSLSAVDSLALPNDIESLTVFWQRSIYCGVLSKLIAEKHYLQDTESLFVIGLLHEIGHLILFMKYPKESKLAVHQAKSKNIPLTKAERALFGTEYGQIGQALMAEWNLPSKFQCITRYHLEPCTATEYMLETNIVHFAHMAAVNKFPGADSFQYPMDQDIMAQIKTSGEDMNALYDEAHELSLAMEKLILGY